MTSRRFWHAVNLRFMLPVAEAVLKGRSLRRESRVAHHRDDFPETDEGWARNVLYAKNEDGSMRLWTIPVEGIPQSIGADLAGERDLGYHHLE